VSSDLEPANIPRLTIGIPIRNGEQSIVRPLESALAQTEPDIEVVISDNASTDATQEVCRAYAEQDGRIRYQRLPENIGLFANFRNAFLLGSAPYFRWLGADDWLEPEYGRRSIEILDANPDGVLVTTGSRLVREDGSAVLGGLRAGPDADGRIERFRQLLDLFALDYRAIDPIYSAMRRSVLAGQPSVLVDSRYASRAGIDTDQALSAALALAGPWLHLPEALAGRQHPTFDPLRVLARRFDIPERMVYGRQLRLCRSINIVLAEQELTVAQRRQARQALARFYLRRRAQIVGRVARRVRKLAARGTPRSQPN